GEGGELFRPRLARAHRKHPVELRAGSFVAVETTAIERALVTSFLAHCPIKLKLQDPCEEVPCIRRVAGNVGLGARIKIGFAARSGRGYALVFRAQVPPCFVVLRRLYFAGEYFPAPLVDKQPKRQECHLLQRSLQQKVDVAGRRRELTDEAELLEIFGC